MTQFTQSYRIPLAAALAVSVLLIASAAHADTLNRQLQVGMSGSDVSALQTFLALNPSIYPEGLVTGFYGPLTQAAVVRFQTQNGISPVGRVGPITLASINGFMASIGGSDDVSAPIISNVSVTRTTGGAVVHWTTNEPAAGLVYTSAAPIRITETGNDVQITGSVAMTDISLHRSQNVTVSGLVLNATYYYVIYTRDIAGNVQFTWPSSFKTN